MIAWLRSLSRLHSRERRAGSNGKGRIIQARYDAAQTTDLNSAHWALADCLSADAANSHAVRKRLRERARYEAANNSYARGMILTLAQDCIGTGPRLQLLSPDAGRNRETEQAFASWSAAIRLADLLRTAVMAQVVDGEVFAVLADGPPPGHDGVTLMPQIIECDRVTSANPSGLGDDIDGIYLDRYDRPIAYSIARRHPGDLRAGTIIYDRVDASNVCHLYRVDRPGQHRGVPEITPALPLFAQLRRYTLAVLTAAETAANVAGILHTDSPPDDQSDPPQPYDLIELQRGTLTVAPDGWDMRQVEPQQPSTTYAEFKRELLNEIARCLNMPYNIAACNSSGYNYSSGRLDHQTYYRSLEVRQSQLVSALLDPILTAWYREYSLGRWMTGSDIAPLHQWFWDGLEHLDPVKEAQAEEMRLRNRTMTYAESYGRRGRDWETELRQCAAEQQLIESLGLRTLGESGGAMQDEEDEE